MLATPSPVVSPPISNARVRSRLWPTANTPAQTTTMATRRLSTVRGTS